MTKLVYVWKIALDRWVRPYDEILLRFKTDATDDSPLVWRVFINGVENLASGFEVQGYVCDKISLRGDVKKYNLHCFGRVRWIGTKAVILATKKTPDTSL